MQPQSNFSWFYCIGINPPLPYTFISSSHHPNPLPFFPFVFASFLSSSFLPLPQDTVFENPVQRLSEEEQEEMGLKYYDSDIHKAAFTLPRFARKVDTW